MASLTRTSRIFRLWGFPLLLLAASASHAEVVFTGTGASQSGDMVIDAAQGTVRGGNLFHSFRVFNVLTGETAVFGGPSGLRNVIARVTGGTSEITGLKSSLIDGQLSVAIRDANFYFINPNGVVIGANGFVNASGSVYVSTADALRLGDGGVFYADPAKDSVLTSADPVAFGFLSARPSPITLDGAWIGSPYTQAPVPPGKTFALIGGDITIQAGIYGGAAIVAPGATISLTSVASAGDAVLGAGAVNVSGFATLGNILISGGSYIDVGDAGDALGFFGDGASGSIYVRAGQLTLAPAGLLAQTFGDADGGVIDIAVRGDLMAATDPESGVVTAILAGTGSADISGGLGKGAAVSLDVGGKLTIATGSFLTSESYGPGAAGDIRIRAGAIEILGRSADEFTGISAENHDIAAGGSLAITTGSIRLLNGGFAGTRNFGPGTGGALRIDADSIHATGIVNSVTGASSVTLSLSTETLGGKAGDMTINTRTLALQDGARISSSTGGSGDAGALTVNASERVDIDGGLSGIFTATAAGATGHAGRLDVATPRLQIRTGVIDSTTVGDGNAGVVTVSVDTLQLSDGAQIRSFSGGFDESNSGALVVGKGNAGSVHVVASGAVTISGASGMRPSGLLAETRGSGAGGDVAVQAHVLRITDGGTISSSSLGSGLAGNIDIRLTDSLEMSGGAVSTRAVASDGGNIHIVAPRLIHLVNSQITTSVESGIGGGGNIFIDPEFVLLQNSQVIANAFGGPGGSIHIIAGQLIADPASIISASSALGIDGAVNIDAPDTDVSAGLALLPAAYLDASSLLRAGCGAARSGLSSLVEVGRGGLPPDPDGYLPSMDLGGFAGSRALASSGADAPPTAMRGRSVQVAVASLPAASCAR